MSDAAFQDAARLDIIQGSGGGGAGGKGGDDGWSEKRGSSHVFLFLLRRPEAGRLFLRSSVCQLAANLPTLWKATSEVRL